MAENSFKNYVIGIILSALFLISMYSFAVGIGNKYEKSFTVDDGMINMTRLERQINSTSTDGENWAERFQSEDTLEVAGALVMYSIWGIMKLMWNSITIMFDVFVGGLANVLGISPIITGTIVALLMICLIFAGWRMIKSGE